MTKKKKKTQLIEYLYNFMIYTYNQCSLYV